MKTINLNCLAHVIILLFMRNLGRDCISIHKYN